MPNFIQPTDLDSASFTVEGAAGTGAIKLNTLPGSPLVGAIQGIAETAAAAEGQEVLTQLAAPSPSLGSRLISYIAAEQHKVYRTIQDKLRDTVSINDFAGVTFDEKFANLLLSGEVAVTIPSAVYRTNGVTILPAHNLQTISFEGGVVFKLVASANAAVFDIRKDTVRTYGIPTLISLGTKDDGLNTCGFRCGTSTTGVPFTYIDGLIHQGFSHSGVLFYQLVGSHLNYVRGLGSKYSVSSLPIAGGIGGSVLELGQMYNSGCLRGLNLHSTSTVLVRGVITNEYCGSEVTEDGAIHLQSCNIVSLNTVYGEANRRNLVKKDSNIVAVNYSPYPAFISAGVPGAADVVSYAGVAFDDRGDCSIKSNAIRVRYIGADIRNGIPLLVGKNLVVPLDDAQSVAFGATTTDIWSVNVVSGEWTTLATVSGQSGNGAARTAHRYTVHAGTGDSTTGFDAGSILNGVLRSDTGTTPSWLRLQGDAIQVNVVSSSYGLTCGVSLLSSRAK